MNEDEEKLLSQLSSDLKETKLQNTAYCNRCIQAEAACAMWKDACLKCESSIKDTMRKMDLKMDMFLGNVLTLLQERLSGSPHLNPELLDEIMRLRPIKISSSP